MKALDALVQAHLQMHPLYHLCVNHVWEGEVVIDLTNKLKSQMMLLFHS
jgi:hypothetical protein